MISSFDGLAFAGPPQASLVQGRDGLLYGTTSPTLPYINGAFGSIFKVTTNGAATLLYTFTNGLDGEVPSSGLVQASDGNFYGTAQSSTNGCGTLYRISPSGTFMVLQQFIGTNGSGPGALVEAADGHFYGMTAGGGAYGGGTVYQTSTNGVLRTLYSFVKTPFFITPLGNNPPPGLVQSTDGTLYGITLESGTVQWTGYSAAVFSITTNGDYNQIFWFPGGGGDGANPKAGLLLASNGCFYGTTEAGGLYGFGAVFQCDTNGNVRSLHSFTGEGDGAFPECMLVMDNQGILYGTTTYGIVSSSSGTVFAITTNGELSTWYTFTNGADGGYPQAGLTAGGDGAFYGTTEDGGDGLGTFFRITPGVVGQFTNLCAFLASGDDGTGSSAPLVLGNDGNFYGATDFPDAGIGDEGIFRVTPEGEVSFVYAVQQPSSLMQAADGSFYVTTSSDGAIFKLTLPGSGNGLTFRDLYDFTNGIDGGQPGGLMQASDGNFYGATSQGGVNGTGTLFRLTPSGRFDTIYTFSPENSLGLEMNPDGISCYGPLVQGPDGNL